MAQTLDRAAPLPGCPCVHHSFIRSVIHSFCAVLRFGAAKKTVPACGDLPSCKGADAQSLCRGTRGGPRLVRMCGGGGAGRKPHHGKSPSLSDKEMVLARWPSGGQGSRGPTRTASPGRSRDSDNLGHAGRCHS